MKTARTLTFVTLAFLAAAQLGFFAIENTTDDADDECFYIDPRFEGSGFD